MPGPIQQIIASTKYNSEPHTMIGTRHNFEEVGSRAIEAIMKADFVAVDAEMTGLQASADLKNGLSCDTIHSRYALSRLGATANLATQWGVAPFRFDEAEGRWVGEAYSFFAFPEGEDRYFQCNAGSMKFLREHKFDFQRWVDGVPWLSRLQEVRETRRVRTVADALALRQDAPAEIGDDRVLGALQDIRAHLGQWLEQLQSGGGAEGEGAEGQAQGGAGAGSGAGENGTENEKQSPPRYLEVCDEDLGGLPAIVLPPVNAFTRKCVHDLVRRELPGCVSVKRDVDQESS